MYCGRYDPGPLLYCKATPTIRELPSNTRCQLLTCCPAEEVVESLPSGLGVANEKEEEEELVAIGTERGWAVVVGDDWAACVYVC